MKRHWSLTPAAFVALFCISALLAPRASTAQVLVGDVFRNGFEGWTDTFSGTPAVAPGPNWGVLLGFGQQLSESSDGRAADGTGYNTGDYTPFLMVNTQVTSPATYDLGARLAAYDNDGFGIVFGYQDNNNYFRVGFRQQANGNLGFPVGASVQKVVGGAITQLGWNNAAIPAIDGTPFDVNVSVNGASWSVSMNGSQVLSGTDAALQPGRYGIHSWGQRATAAADPKVGVLVDSIGITSSSVNHTTDFSSAVPTAWRPLVMRNANGALGTGGDDKGNFRQDFRNGTIQDDSNGYEWATTTAPNVDFISPAVVVNEPGSASWSDYQMKVRIQNGDNDGAGLLVRVADDDSFYRVNFALEAMGTGTTRCPRGMSIQKYDNGVWSELYRDDQMSPLFLFTEDMPFDVTVNLVGNGIGVQVVNDPNGAATAYSYPLVFDATAPILTGSVGFANWGNGEAANGVIYSRYGGDGLVLLQVIPEPSTLALFGLASVLSLAFWRRR